MPDEVLDHQVDEEAESENEANQRGDAHELCGKLVASP